MGVESRLKAYADLVDTRLDDVLPPISGAPRELHEAMRYASMGSGKRLRPAMLLATTEAVGGSIDSALDAACAVELIHAFSLVHDDLPALDDDDLRRGKPTCHVKFGEAIAILAGDALFATAFKTLLQSPLPPAVALRCALVLTEATSRLVNGETIDILSEGKTIDADTLQLIHERKTGALIAACCEIGAIVGGADEGQIASLRRYGERVGLAFQIADDVLNASGDAEQLGKSAGSDAARGKATYPAVHGLEAARDRARQVAEEGIEELGEIPQNAVLVEFARFAIERLR